LRRKLVVVRAAARVMCDRTNASTLRRQRIVKHHLAVLKPRRASKQCTQSDVWTGVVALRVDVQGVKHFVIAMQDVRHLLTLLSCNMLLKRVMKWCLRWEAHIR
jgi:hypothetical protein